MAMCECEKNTVFERQFTRFMVEVVRNARKSFLRKRNSVVNHELLSPDMDCYSVHQVDDMNEFPAVTDYRCLGDCFAEQQLSMAIELLTDREKQVLFMSCIGNMSRCDIACFQNCNQQNISNIRKSALKKMMLALEGCEHEL